jgi:RNA polymerase sigma-70 factor (ECF subfamily)
VAFRHEVADFGAFYERTYTAAYRTALGICGDPSLAADVTQDAYVTAYRDRAGFRGDAPGGAWLQRIVVNAAISGLRRRQVRWAEPLDPDRGDVASPASASADALDMRVALDSLSPKARAAVVLRYYHGYDYDTIANVLETSSGNVGALLSRSLHRLRQVMADPADALVSTARTGEVRHGR